MRVDQAGLVEVVKDRHLPTARHLQQDDVVLPGNRPIRIADHVLEQRQPDGFVQAEPAGIELAVRHQFRPEPFGQRLEVLREKSIAREVAAWIVRVGVPDPQQPHTQAEIRDQVEHAVAQVLVDHVAFELVRQGP